MVQPDAAADRRRPLVSRLQRTLLVPLAIGAVALAPSLSQAADTPRASLTQLENDLMCLACHEPLSLAQSPESFSERAYLRQLIAQGLTVQQIERQMVAQYGTAVLAKPPARGFNLLIYVLPPLLLAIGIVTLLFTLPKWRRRSQLAASAPVPEGPPLDPEEARRLDEDLARHT